MKLDKEAAINLLREEANRSEKESIDPNWGSKIERLSALCEVGVSKTHIAFLGTAILAKSLDRNADLYAIKPTHAQHNKNAFSARTLCHQVLVRAAAELGFNLGVTGREPLNNQPYFRMTRLGDNTPVHAGGKAAFNYMMELVKELSELQSEKQARDALRAFIAVRRRYQPHYTVGHGRVTITPEKLTTVIVDFVKDDSEGGRRAQAVVAGLFDVFAGTGRVESGRVNDPSRKYPGDVCIRMAEEPERWEKAIEVRDKPVSVSDIQIFGKKCVDMGVREAAVIMVAESQPLIDNKEISAWALRFGIGLTLFHGWPSLIDQSLFWAELPKPDAALEAVERIEERLVSVEASPESVTLWQSLVRSN